MFDEHEISCFWSVQEPVSRRLEKKVIAAVLVKYVVHTPRKCKEGKRQPPKLKGHSKTFQYQYILKTSEEQTYSMCIWHHPAGTGD